MRTIIIGDIHGCIEPFCSLLETLKPEKSDRLLLLGDLFDRGPSSWEVFQKVMELEQTYGENFILLRGNHEDYLLQSELSASLRKIWERVGRPATERSFRSHGMNMYDAAPWLKEHCRLFWKDDGFQCVHAGVKNEPIEETEIHTLIHDHGIVRKNAYQGILTIVGHIALEAPTWFDGNGQEAILSYGIRYKLPKSGVICIDTGCGKGGALTGMVIEDQMFTLFCAGSSGI